MFKSIAHIGIAVKNLEEAKRLFEKLTHTAPDHEEEVPDQRVATAMFRFGETSLELTAATHPDSPIARFIAKRGEGVHHISFVVDDIEAEMKRLKQQGFQLIDEQPREGAEQCWVAFLHPKSTNGVLIEISQKRRD
jgi:methylmalonyl-CoA/ethylmalonyl-CoA epimerase